VLPSTKPTPNPQLSLRDIETTRRAQRRQLRQVINNRTPTTTIHDEPRDVAPAPHQRRLRTYEENK